MHKKLVNRCTLDITLIPQGPILIKSGDQGADPTKPDMEFVETYHKGDRVIYLPGSSLKGAIRAHAERICRSVGGEKSHEDYDKVWANDPLADKYKYLEKETGGRKEKKSAPEIHKLSSFTDRLFGNTYISSRLRIEDAYPKDLNNLQIEERNGVAIDRVFGSVAVGPFNYQVCTAGEFKTKIHLKNFSLAQLGLVGLVLRDLHEGWFGIGFAKSRGLGFMEVRYESALIQYPTCLPQGEDGKTIRQMGTANTWDRTMLLGVGEFLNDQNNESTGSQECKKYGMTFPDHHKTPVAAKAMPLGLGVEINWPVNQIDSLFTPCVDHWNALIPAGRAA